MIRFGSFRLAQIALPAAVLAATLLHISTSLSTVHSQSTQLTVVSAANYEATVTPDSIAAAFGTGLAPTTQAAPGVPLPTSLAGTTVKVNGRDAGIFFVSAGQVNFLIPAATEIGSVTVVIRASNGATFTGTMQVRAIAPVVFTANASGQGVPAAVALRVRGTVQTFEPLSRYDTQQQRFVSVPLDLGPSTDQIFLIVYGGGVRRRGSLTDVSAKLGGVNAPVMFAGPAPGFVGVDQLNVGPLPRNLVGTGSVKLLVSVIGAASSNETDIEIAQPCGGSGVQITSLSATNLLAGQEFIINGANFSATAAENVVRVIGDETQPEAQVIEAAANRLKGSCSEGWW